MSDTEATNQAWGELIALSDEVQELVELRKELGAEVSSEQTRRAVLDRARELGFDTLSMLLPVPEELLDFDAQTLLQQVDPSCAKFGPLTLRRLGDWLSQVVGFDDWLVGYVDEFARTGKSSALFDSVGGRIEALRFGENEKAGAIVAFLTPLTPLETKIEELRDKCVAEWGGIPRMKPETQQEAARFYRLFEEGKTNRQIAEMELEDFRLRAASDEEYKTELRLMTDRVRQLRKRYREYVIKVGELVSRDSD